MVLGSGNTGKAGACAELCLWWCVLLELLRKKRDCVMPALLKNIAVFLFDFAALSPKEPLGVLPQPARYRAFKEIVFIVSLEQDSVSEGPGGEAEVSPGVGLGAVLPEGGNAGSPKPR